MTTAKTMIFSEIVSLLQKVVDKIPILSKIPLLKNATFLMMVVPFLVPYATKTLKWIFNTVTYPFRSHKKQKEEKMEKKVLVEIGKDVTNINKRLDIMENTIHEIKSRPDIPTKVNRPEVNLNNNRSVLKV